MVVDFLSSPTEIEYAFNTAVSVVITSGIHQLEMRAPIAAAAPEARNNETPEITCFLVVYRAPRSAK
jgi:hypothetical protein